MKRGNNSAYSQAKDAYRAGKKVILYHKNVATDTDYRFYLHAGP